jgi:hypothetical protein
MSPFRLATAALLLFALAACDDASPDVATSTPAAPSASPVTAAASAVAAPQLCDFLKKKLPEWQSISGEGAAQAQLAIDLFAFYQEQGALPVGKEIDDQARSQCPAIRFEVLRAAGIKDLLIV